MTNVHKIWVLHGPNLNLLGQREPDVYGHVSLADLNGELTTFATQHDVALTCHQHNAEHALIELIHQAKVDHVQCIVFNPAAFAHTSIALRDALLAVNIPFIEVHLTNVDAREPFRQQSYFSDIALGVISGFGVQSYLLGLHAAVKYVQCKC